MDCAVVAGFLICGPLAPAGQTATTPPEPPLPLVEQMQRCWNVPVGAEPTLGKFAFDVSFDDRGVPVTIAGVNPTPASKVAAQTEESAARAIERCAPYTGTEARQYRVVFDTAEMF